MSALATPAVVRNVLGDERPVTAVFDDGAYTCPFCGAAVQAHEVEGGCPNPACDAGRWATVERAQARKDERARRARELEETKSRLRAQRAASERYQAQRAAELAEARDAGYCTLCYSHSGGRRKVRHRPGHDHVTR